MKITNFDPNSSFSVDENFFKIYFFLISLFLSFLFIFVGQGKSA
jgi:hypothetical protein